MKDPILIEASRLKKERGIIEAAKYLSEQAVTFPFYTEEFYKYYFKSIAYSFEDPELYTQIESSLDSLINTLETKKIYDDNYIDACKYLYNYYMRIGDGNKAMVTNSRINNTINPNSSGYLYDLKESFERTSSATQLFTTNQHIKDIESIFNTMMWNFLDIAGQLSCDLKFNMQCYKTVSMGYQQFNHFNRLKWDIDLDYIRNDEEAIYDYYDEKDIEKFKRVFKNYSPEILILSYNHYYYELFPQALNFKLEFFLKDYNDIDSFGKHFEEFVSYDEYGNPDMTSFNGLAFDRAVYLAREFEKQYFI